MRVTKNIKEYLSEIGRKGGKTKSEKKSDAVKENGKKGGRPRNKEKNK